MIERIRRNLESPLSWTIIGIMVSGTLGFVGMWKVFEDRHEESVTRFARLETIVLSNTAWRAKLEQEHSDLQERVSKLEGQFEQHVKDDRREFDGRAGK